MNKYFKLKILFVAIIFCGVFGVAESSQAANWYVDNSVISSGNGMTWESAWKNFSNISWGSISGGDNIYISGGVTSQTYTESLTIGASGSTNNYISIKPGAASPSPSGHDGNVIIVATSGYGGIYLSAKNWIKISGNDGAGNQKIIVDNTNMNGAQGIYLDNLSNVYHIILEYLEVKNVVHPACPFNSALIDGRATTVPYVEISHCYLHGSDSDALWLTIDSDDVSDYGRWSIHDSTILDMKDDGIESSWSGMDFYNNIIGDRRPNACDPGQHPDTFQLQTKWYRIYNNTIRNWMVDSATNENVIYNQQLYAGQCGHTSIYNNLFYEAPGATGGAWAITLATGLASVEPCASYSDVNVLNNTFTGPYQADILLALSQATQITQSSQFHDVYFENNIHNSSGGYNLDTITGGGFTPVHGNHGSGANMAIDYNDYYGVSNAGGSHSIISDPNLDVNYKPQLSSPVKDAGVSWSSLFTIDKDNISRPQGSTWDIGAYEYVSASDTTPPAAPTGLSVQ